MPEEDVSPPAYYSETTSSINLEKVDIQPRYHDPNVDFEDAEQPFPSNTFSTNENPPMYEEELPAYANAEPRGNNNNAGTYRDADDSIPTLLHSISLICAIFSLLFTPLLELIPMILYCIFQLPMRQQTQIMTFLNHLDLIVTIVVLICYLIIFTLIAVFTSGIGLLFFILLIPYLVVIMQLIHFAQARSKYFQEMGDRLIGRGDLIKIFPSLHTEHQMAEQDTKIVDFYRKWCTLLSSEEVKRSYWQSHTFLCISLPNGFLGGLEEQIFLTIQRYLVNPSLYQQGELARQIESILHQINANRANNDIRTVDKYGFYNSKMVKITDKEKQSDCQLDDAQLAAQLQKQFDQESQSAAAQEREDESLATVMNRKGNSIATVVPKRSCKYGYSCFRKNPKHFVEFSHPVGFERVKEQMYQFNTISRGEEDEGLDDDISIEDSRSEDLEVDEEYVYGGRSRPNDSISPRDPYQYSFPGQMDSGNVPAATVPINTSLIPGIKELLPCASVESIISALKQTNNDPNAACQILLANSK